jgi:hypothetical protein
MERMEGAGLTAVAIRKMAADVGAHISARSTLATVKAFISPPLMSVFIYALDSNQFRSF